MDMIETKALEFAYPAEEGEKPVLALRGVDTAIEKGSFVVVLGHNGSGKSTFAKSLNAILLPCGGKVYVEGMDTQDEACLLEIRRRVGMVFQNPDNQMVANVVEEDVAFAPENLGVPPEEIRTRIDRGERALVTTLTVKMAEDLTDYLEEHGVKTKYMHHEVDTFERMEIIKDLRLGSIDVVVGINLLREGLDLPEVSLVAILDADKEGFLRSETSLIQTIGRAARNAEGMVIMYADVVTDSMDRAITETERRRAIQMAYNQEHGIVPRTIVKAIADSIEISDKAENAKRNTRRMGKMEREAAIERLTREMKEAAKLLEFEHAAFLRDQIDRLRRGENPTVDSAAETERKQNHAQTQRKGRKYLGKR